MEAVNLVTAYCQFYNNTINFIEFLIGNMEKEVMSAPEASSPEVAYSYTNKKFHVRKQQDILQEAKLMFTQYDTKFKWLKSI